MRKLILIAAVLLSSLMMVQAQDFPTGEYFYIQSAQAEHTMKGFWDLPGYKPSFKKGEPLKVYTLEPRASDRLFKFEDAGDGFFYIIPKNSNRRGRLDVSGNKQGNGVKIQVWEENNSSAQKFKIEYTKSGKFKIYTAHGDVVCLAGKSHDDGTQVHTWQDHEGEFTEWIFIREKDLKKRRYYPSYFHKEPKFFMGSSDTQFFIEFQSAFGGGSKGTAKVKNIEGNTVILEYTTTGINPATGKESTNTNTMTIVVENGKYIRGKDSGYEEIGEPDGNKLTLSGGQSAIDIFRF